MARHQFYKQKITAPKGAVIRSAYQRRWKSEVKGDAPLRDN